MGENIIPGGWTEFKTDIGEEKSIFDEALEGLLGVDYSPIAVATQVVEGVNYRFFCNAKGVYPNAPNEAVLIEIFKPLEGKASIKEIKKIT